MAFAAGDRVSTTVTTRVLATTDTPIYSTSVTVRILGTLKPCVEVTKCPSWLTEVLRRRLHRFAALWQILRTDGQEFHFTDHCGALPYEGNTYVPSGGPAASAREHESGEREHTVELSAAIIVGGAETSELEAGLWEDAKVTERIVDWRYPWAGCFRHHRWYLRDVQWDGEVWTAQLGGISSRIQGPNGSVYARDCTHEFGDQFGNPTVVGCHFDVAGTQQSGTVATVVSDKRTFTANLTAALGSDYFINGRLVWTSGDNAPVTSAVRKADETSAGVYQIEVEMSLPEVIQVADGFDIRQGCQKRFLEDCTPKAQTQDFAGHRFMPGEDGMKVVPGIG